MPRIRPVIHESLRIAEKYKLHKHSHRFEPQIRTSNPQRSPFPQETENRALRFETRKHHAYLSKQEWCQTH